MTQIDKVAIAAKKEAQRAIQYPRVKTEEAVVLEPVVELELTYRELQAKAKSLGLKSSGSKVVLLERIAAT